MTSNQAYLPPRPAGGDDLDVLVRHRVRMFAEMGFSSADDFAELSAACRTWFASALADGRYLGWLIAPAAVVTGDPAYNGVSLDVPAGDDDAHRILRFVDADGRVHRMKCVME